MASYAAKFSLVGLAVATLFFAASVTPSLLLRHYAFQGLHSGLAPAVGFGLPMATSRPVGYGHNYAPGDYIDAWRAVTDASDWSEEEISRLKSHFRPPDEAANRSAASRCSRSSKPINVLAASDLMKARP